VSNVALGQAAWKKFLSPSKARGGEELGQRHELHVSCLVLVDLSALAIRERKVRDGFPQVCKASM